MTNKRQYHSYPTKSKDANLAIGFDSIGLSCIMNAWKCAFTNGSIHFSTNNNEIERCQRHCQPYTFCSCWGFHTCPMPSQTFSLGVFETMLYPFFVPFPFFIAFGVCSSVTRRNENSPCNRYSTSVPAKAGIQDTYSQNSERKTQCCSVHSKCYLQQVLSALFSSI